MDQQEPHNLVMGSCVKANYMTSDWSDVFALSCTEARLYGFWVNQYDFKVNSKKVNFYGFYINHYVRTIKFRAEFTIDQIDICLDVRTFGWVPNQLTYHFIGT